MLTASETASWIFRVVKWDGILPAIVWSLPVFVRIALPNRREAVEVTAVVLPIVALFVRFKRGRQSIIGNHCRIVTRKIQIAVFCLGIFVRVLIDAVMVLTHVMPKGAAFGTTTDVIVWSALYSIYVVAMAIAMYPGTASPSHEPPMADCDRTWK